MCSLRNRLDMGLLKYVRRVIPKSGNLATNQAIFGSVNKVGPVNIHKVTLNMIFLIMVSNSLSVLSKKYLSTKKVSLKHFDRLWNPIQYTFSHTLDNLRPLKLPNYWRLSNPRLILLDAFHEVLHYHHIEDAVAHPRVLTIVVVGQPFVIAGGPLNLYVLVYVHRVHTCYIRYSI